MSCQPWSMEQLLSQRTTKQFLCWLILLRQTREGYYCKYINKNYKNVQCQYNNYNYRPTWTHKSPLIVPGAEFLGSVAPRRTRPVFTASNPSHT